MGNKKRKKQKKKKRQNQQLSNNASQEVKSMDDLTVFANDIDTVARAKAAAAFEFTDVTPEEIKHLATIRESNSAPNTPETAWLKNTRDYELLRYLRGHKHDMKKTMEFLTDSSRWRHERKVKDIRARYAAAAQQESTVTQDAAEDAEIDRTTPKFMLDYFPCGKIGESNGRSISLYRLTMVDFPAVLEHDLVEQVINVNLIQLAADWENYPQGKGILIVDLWYNEDDDRPVSGWGWNSYISALTTVSKAVSKQIDPHFPETFSKVFIVRPPRIFWATWKVAKYIVSDRTRSKINVLGSTEDSWGPLYEHVPKALLPVYLGGTNLSPSISPGGKMH